MKKFVLAKKIGMSQYLDKEGRVIPVTVLEAGPCEVVGIKAGVRPGTSQVQIAYGAKADRKFSKSTLGFFKKAGIVPKAILKSFIVDENSIKDVKQIGADLFSSEELVTVSGKSSGKGFAGTIKRHNFQRGRMTHGSKMHRIPGSIGSGTDPGRVVKGKRMAGHLGSERVTVKNLKVVSVDGEKGYLYLQGAVPGKKDSVVEVYN